ncbi:hypothetical protein Ahy_B02g059303 [Arachis hypogaea]|uniref:Hemerythrin-like domain-containing protein n=1 Tax=Arachis hypogaea TaxID=3818 RepID=A0A445AGK4_ARAHY|nr:hypothetical protein Ahy_B02g059303 [Arachis hypogaea]
MMGNCLRRSEKLTAEIVPHEGSTSYHAVRLRGSPESILNAYVRLASVSTNSIPSDRRFLPPASTTSTAARSRVPDCTDNEITTTVQVRSEGVTGSRDALLRFIDSRFPGLSSAPPQAYAPTAMAAVVSKGEVETTSLMVRMTKMQHKSMTWHLERMVRWAEDLARRGGRRAVDPKVGSWRMEVRKFSKSYCQLLEVMMEHAQMEERVLFPIFDSADREAEAEAEEAEEDTEVEEAEVEAQAEAEKRGTRRDDGEPMTKGGGVTAVTRVAVAIMSHPREREIGTRASDQGGGVVTVTCVIVEVRNASRPAAAQPRPTARWRSSHRAEERGSPRRWRRRDGGGRSYREIPICRVVPSYSIFTLTVLWWRY